MAAVTSNAEAPRNDGGPADGSPYLGCTVSVITHSETRYVGKLYTIDTKDSSIAVTNVRSMGSEGRRKTGPQIPAEPDKDLGIVLFRGVDIKDLRVLPSDPTPAPQPAPPPPVVPPTLSTGTPSTMYPAPPPSFQDSYGTAPGGPGGQPPYGGRWTQNGMPPTLPPMNPYGHMQSQYNPYGYYGQAPMGMTQPTPAAVPPQPTVPVSQPPATTVPPTSAPAPPPAASRAYPSQGVPTMPVTSLNFTTPPVVDGTIPPQTKVAPARTDGPQKADGVAPPQQPRKVWATPMARPAQQAPPPQQQVQPQPQQAQKQQQQQQHPQQQRVSAAAQSGAKPTQKDANRRVEASTQPVVAQKAPPPKGPAPPAPRPTSFAAAARANRDNPSGALPPKPSAQTGAPSAGTRGAPSQSNQGSSRRTGNQNGSHYQNTRWAHRTGVNSPKSYNPQLVASVGEDFNFEAMHLKFKKEEIFEGLGAKKAADKPNTGPSYDMDDFFDSLSCETLDRQGPREGGGRNRYAEQRKLDQETFGATQVRSTNRYGGGGGGRGRGGGGRSGSNRRGYRTGSRESQASAQA
mmetsp:Transcript_12292/g.44821  ORF Transcript_12292/g.44821 Transcript_12292/m.44821 type:complete len:572 (+) Transcript_12292:125-1840(+)